jgi:hypothetical protein
VPHDSKTCIVLTTGVRNLQLICTYRSRIKPLPPKISRQYHSRQKFGANIILAKNLAPILFAPKISHQYYSRQKFGGNIIRAKKISAKILKMIF